jgi:predicted nucleic acid-binding protein
LINDVTFVTDTHALIHHLTGRKRRLGQRARRTFERVERGVDTILIPFTVLEEVMLLAEAGRFDFLCRSGIWSSR